jgi:type I restriction enzyme S subunit
VAVKACQEQEDQPILHVIEDAKTKGHNQQFDDAVMIAGIVNALYSEKFPLGRKRLQKCLYLLRRHQEESIEPFKKKAAGPYADEIRYKGGEPIAKSCKYIVATTTKGKGTTFAPGANIKQALQYIKNWGKEKDIEWVAHNLKYKKTDELELLATVDMAAFELENNETEVTVSTIKELIASSAEWKDKLKRQFFNDAGIAQALIERKRLRLGG